MSFWNTSDGQKPETDGSFEMGGGDLPPMPKGTEAISVPTEVKWDVYEHKEESVRYISIRWDVVDGEFKNRVVFQKLWVIEADPRKADDKKQQQVDKSKRMLAAIDANAGGKLMQIDREPTDMELAAALCHKPMRVKYGVWNDQETKQPKGNWVMAVQSSSSKPKPQQQPQQQAPTNSVGDDDIGF